MNLLLFLKKKTESTSNSKYLISKDNFQSNFWQYGEFIPEIHSLMSKNISSSFENKKIIIFMFYSVADTYHQNLLLFCNTLALKNPKFLIIAIAMGGHETLSNVNSDDLCHLLLVSDKNFEITNKFKINNRLGATIISTNQGKVLFSQEKLIKIPLLQRLVKKFTKDLGE
jgi:hypothetical protein